MSILRQLLMGSKRPCHYEEPGQQAELCICLCTVVCSAEKWAEASSRFLKQLVGDGHSDADVDHSYGNIVLALAGDNGLW